MKDSLELKVKFTKIGNKVKFKLPVRMFCVRMCNEVQNSMTLSKEDGLIKAWLGDVDQVFKNNNTVIKKVCLNFVYDSCDKPKK